MRTSILAVMVFVLGIWTSSSVQAARWIGIGPTVDGGEAVAVLPGGVVLAGGSAVFRSVDGGQTWRIVLEAGDFIAFAVDPTNEAVAYAGREIPGPGSIPGGRGQIWRTADGGEHWALSFSTSNGVVALAVDPADPTNIYAATGGSSVYASTDGGASWQQLMGGNAVSLAVAPGTPSTLYATNVINGPVAVFSKSTDEGQTWSSIPTPGLGCCLEIDPNDPATIYYAVRKTVIRTDGAGNGTPILTHDQYDVSAIAVDPNDSETLYVSLYQGGVLKTTNGGATWNQASEGLFRANVVALEVDASNPGTVYAALGELPLVKGRGIYKTTNGGGRWTSLKSGLTAKKVTALAVPSADPDRLHAGTLGEGLFMSLDGGDSWNAVTSLGYPRTINGIAIAPDDPDKLLAAAVWFDNPSQSGVAFSSNGGQQFLFGLPNAAATSVAVAPGAPGTAYAGTFPLPFAPQTGVFTSQNGFAGGAGNWGLTLGSTRLFLSIAVAADASSTVYAGSSGVGLYRTTTGGAPWSPVGGGLTPFYFHALAFVAGGSSTLYAGTEVGVWKGTNAGTVWSSSGLDEFQVYALAVDAAHPGTLYAGTARDGVFRSTDGGANWTSFNNGLGNDTVRALAIVPGLAQKLLAGTDAGVFSYVAVCGDAVIDIGEDCDGGGAVTDDCCTSGCRIEDDSTPCDDADPSTVGDTCHAGTCIGTTATSSTISTSSTVPTASSTTNTAPLATTTTTSPAFCEQDGFAGALCELDRLAAAPLCTSGLNRRFDRFSATKLHITRKLLVKAQQRHERSGKTRPLNRLLTKAGNRLDAIVNRAHGRGRVPQDCQRVIEQSVGRIRNRVLGLRVGATT